MSIRKQLLTLAAPLALLAGCATGLPTQVSRFQALPVPQGQSFYIQPADPELRGSLEFAQYADLVRRNLIAQGYSDTDSAQGAALVVSLDYGVDGGRTKIVTTPGFGGGFHRPFLWHPGFYRGFNQPFYYGWNDPFWGSGFDYPDVRSYVVYESYLDMDIKRAVDGQSLFEGTARARSRSDDLPALVPNLVEAMFTGFPGNSGETVRITVPPPERRDS